jgi:hypothetical protein
MAKTTLPTSIKNELEEWNFKSGAVMICLVAYSDGHDLRSFQSVFTHYVIYPI